jgi:hypothetical protein
MMLFAVNKGRELLDYVPLPPSYNATPDPYSPPIYGTKPNDPRSSNP